MNVPRRRLACPSLTNPIDTGDGFLARLIPSGNTITAEALASLCAAARAHGNGILEITARGNIQVRGLRPSAIATFAETVRALDIATDGVPITVDPLAGLDSDEAIDTIALAGALRTRLLRESFSGQLGPKVSVVVDGGTTLHLDQLTADIRLRAEAAPGRPRIAIALGGNAFDAAPVGAFSPMEVLEITIRILETIANRGRDARGRDLIHDGGLAALQSTTALLTHTAPRAPLRPPSEPIGMHRLRGGHVALGIGFPFGHINAELLAELTDAAKTSSALGIRTTHRALLVVCACAEVATQLAATAERLRFITRVDDPRRYIATCAGAPICASARIPSRALAPVVAAAAAGLLDGSFVLHLSGCAKGCAHPGESTLTLIGRHGGCDVVINGKAGDVPVGSVVMEALPSRLAMLAGEISQSRRHGERAVEALARLGAIRTTSMLTEASHG